MAMSEKRLERKVRREAKVLVREVRRALADLLARPVRVTEIDADLTELRKLF